MKNNSNKREASYGNIKPVVISYKALKHNFQQNTKEGILAELHALLEVGRMHHKPLNMMAQFLGTLVRDGTHVLFIDGSTSLKLQADIFSKTGWCVNIRHRG